jgi:hypothetical protein
VRPAVVGDYFEAPANANKALDDAAAARSIVGDSVKQDDDATALSPRWALPSAETDIAVPKRNVLTGLWCWYDDRPARRMKNPARSDRRHPDDGRSERDDEYGAESAESPG